MQRRRALLASMVATLAPGCGGEAVDPCVEGQPGLHFTVHTPYAMEAQAYLTAYFANGMSVNLIGTWPFGEYPSGLAELRAAYPTEASNGPATFMFYTRPDPGRAGSAQVNVDLSSCTEVEIFTSDLGPDAGVPDAG
jgi:hypothetical protein